MKPINFLPILFLLLLLSPSSGNAAGSMLRITCEGFDVGAEVTINGQFKGECPIDLQVPAGTVKLQVVKRVRKDNPDLDRILDQDIRIGDGVVKKIELKLVRRGFFTTSEKATKGDAKAMYYMGMYYSKDYSSVYGIPESREKEIEWYLRAAEAGDSSAMMEIAKAYEDGDGVQKNFEKSKQWYRRALEIYRKEAEEGNSNAMDALGTAYGTGNGVPLDKEKAAMWFRQAKAKGSNNAQMFLDALLGLQQ